MNRDARAIDVSSPVVAGLPWPRTLLAKQAGQR